MGVETAAADPTQDVHRSIQDEARRSFLGGLITLTTLGLIPQLSSTDDIAITSTANDNTQVLVASSLLNSFHQISEALTSIHRTLLSQAIDLDPEAREVLNRRLWDLYVT